MRTNEVVLIGDKPFVHHNLLIDAEARVKRLEEALGKIHAALCIDADCDIAIFLAKEAMEAE